MRKLGIPAVMQPSRSSRRWLGALLALLMLFVGVALFTPLHKHQRGQASQRCSFDGLENAFTQTAESTIHLNQDLSTEFLLVRSEVAILFARASQSESSRAPPALSL